MALTPLELDEQGATFWERFQKNPDSENAWNWLLWHALHTPFSVTAFFQVYTALPAHFQQDARFVKMVIERLLSLQNGEALRKAASPDMLNFFEQQALTDPRGHWALFQLKVIENTPRATFHARTFLSQTGAVDFVLKLAKEAALKDRLREAYVLAEILLGYRDSETHKEFCAGIAARYGETERARALYQQLEAEDPAFILQKALCLPIIYRSTAHIQRTRQRLKKELIHIFKQRQVIARQGRHLDIKYPFYLAYQGHNDRELVSLLGDIYVYFLQGSRQPSARQSSEGATSIAPSPLENKRHIVVICAFFYRHSVSVCFKNTLIYMANQPETHVTFIYTGTKTDSFTREYIAAADAWLHTSDRSRIVRYLKQQNVDVVIYPEVGMSPLVYTLAMERFAPVQITLTGHPVTTGLPHMDYYALNALDVPPDVEKHFRETPMLLPSGLGDFDPISPPDPELPLLWSEGGHHYLCPANLFKIHPDMDSWLRNILAHDDQAHIYFFKTEQNQNHELLRARWEKSIGAVQTRIHFLPWLPVKHFARHVQAAHVIFDPPHFGSGTTSRLVFGLGQMLVSWPTEHMAGRIVAGAYELMELSEFIPENAEEALQLALRLARDNDFRRACQEKVKSRSHRMFQTGNGKPLYEMIKNILQNHPKG